MIIIMHNKFSVAHALALLVSVRLCHGDLVRGGGRQQQQQEAVPCNDDYNYRTDGYLSSPRARVCVCLCIAFRPLVCACE